MPEEMIKMDTTNKPTVRPTTKITRKTLVRLVSPPPRSLSLFHSIADGVDDAVVRADTETQIKVLNVGVDVAVVLAEIHADQDQLMMVWFERRYTSADQGAE